MFFLLYLAKVSILRPQPPVLQQSVFYLGSEKGEREGVSGGKLWVFFFDFQRVERGHASFFSLFLSPLSPPLTVVAVVVLVVGDGVADSDADGGADGGARDAASGAAAPAPEKREKKRRFSRGS